MSLKIGFLLYPNLTQLDLTGPFEVFSHVPEAEIHLIWKTLDPVAADSGMKIMPTTTFEDCPDLDIICVPGGPGQMDLMEDEETLAFLRAKAEGCKYVTSVCTGSLVLGAAGLLDGYKATTYWAATDFLKSFGAEYVNKRVVIDRNRISGGGVTAGVDFGLTVVAEMFGERAAKMIQLGIEYNPAPPFDAGSPEKAEPEIVEALKAAMAVNISRRSEQTRKSA